MTATEHQLAEIHTLLTRAMEACPDCDEIDRAEDLLNELRTQLAQVTA